MIYSFETVLQVRDFISIHLLSIYVYICINFLFISSSIVVVIVFILCLEHSWKQTLLVGLGSGTTLKSLLVKALQVTFQSKLYECTGFYTPT